MTPPLQLLLLLAANLAATPPRDTASAATDSVHTDSMPVARVTLTFGAAQGAATVRSFDLTVSGTPGVRRRGATPAATQLRFVREPDALSAELARRVASGERYQQVDALIERDGGTIALHLHDVQVLSTRLVMNGDDIALSQQRLAIEESIAQLSAQQAEARRQLGATEALAKERLSPPLELARARSDVEVVEKRLVAQRHRLTLVNRQISAWAPVQEEVSLNAARAEIETR